MTLCPVCESRRVVLVLSPNPRAFCAMCGARWVQDGSRQTGFVKGVTGPDYRRTPPRER
jgi:hypothetical protein